MAEWSNAAVLKTVEPKGSGGSNPSLSATRKEKMTSVFINPNLLVQRNDPFTTGIVYMPIGLASTVASVQMHGFEVKVIDSFGEAPKKARIIGKFMYLGINTDEIIDLLPSDVSLICIYANQLINHSSISEIIIALKKTYSNIPILMLENTQAVTAYDLRSVADEFLKIGVDYVLTGEAEKRLPIIMKALKNNESVAKCDGLYGKDFSNPASTVIEDLDSLHMPAWDKFPIKNYWGLKHAHGPLTSKKYLPILTSRGCPYKCKFCVVPATNFLKWRGRSATNVVDEIEYFQKEFDVNEFHLEDLDPTVNDKRTKEICEEIIRRKIIITWKIVAGTKVETMRSEETVALMAKAGCTYISISPESGSPRIMKLMEKPFKVNHAVKLISKMNKVHIKSQACFVLGYPGETDEDRKMTRVLAKKLTLGGLDEIAIFIISPVPGSKIFDEFKNIPVLSELNFTPTWRDDYRKLNHFRIGLYRSFLLWKFLHFPMKIIRQCYNFMLGRFETKMEMVPYKGLLWKRLEYLSNKKNKVLEK